jgi:hypothetical protein
MSSYNPEEIDHPSFGAISWSRVTGDRGPFFMASLKHTGWVEIEIHEARATVNGAHTRLSTAGKRSIVRVAMTEEQFARFITTPNRGSGAPCTITRREGLQIPQCPPDKQASQYRKEMETKARVTADSLKEALALLKKALAGKTVRKGDLKDIQEEVARAAREVGANMPYLMKLFDEYLDTVTSEASAHFENHVRTRLDDLGISALQAEGLGLPALPED